MIDMTTGYISPASTAQMLGVTGQRIRQMMAEGKLRYVWTPIGRLIVKESAEQLRRERLAKAGAFS